MVFKTPSYRLSCISSGIWLKVGSVFPLPPPLRRDGDRRRLLSLRLRDRGRRREREGDLRRREGDLRLDLDRVRLGEDRLGGDGEYFRRGEGRLLGDREEFRFGDRERSLFAVGE